MTMGPSDWRTKPVVASWGGKLVIDMDDVRSGQFGGGYSLV
jgi:hypothetical protein